MSRKLKYKNSRAVNLVTHQNPKLPVSEQYRHLRTNILFSSVDNEIKSIVVTSPEPSDGKSTVAANLAIVLAQQEKSVILVDTDLRKPSIHYTFNISNGDGLTNVLAKNICLEEAIYKTVVPNLSILTSGPIPPNPSELLNSKAMETVVEQLNNTFDYVVFDTPPVLAVTDSQIMANKCDGVVMVIASGKTQRDHSMKAKELLIKTKSQLLGVVINRVKSSSNQYYYEYK